MSNVLNDLTSGPPVRAARIHNGQVVIKLPQSARELLQKAADAQGISLSAVIRLAIAEYLQRRGYIK